MSVTTDEFNHPMNRRSDVSGEPSLWEISRRLDRQDERIEKGFAKVEGKIDALQFVPITLYHSEQLHQDTRIKTLEDANTRKSQLIAGALVAIAVNVIVLLIAARGGL